MGYMILILKNAWGPKGQLVKENCVWGQTLLIIISSQMFHCTTIAAKLPCPSLLLCSFDMRDTSPSSANYQVLNRHEAEQAGAGRQEHADGLLPDSVNLFHVCKTRSSAASPCRSPCDPSGGYLGRHEKSHVPSLPLSGPVQYVCLNRATSFQWTERKNGFLHLSARISFERLIVPRRRGQVGVSQLYSGTESVMNETK